MSEALPVVYLARHGDTAWTNSGQRTGLADLPLAADGELHARLLGKRLQGLKFVKVFTSPLQTAARTCELAGFGAVAEVNQIGERADGWCRVPVWSAAMSFFFPREHFIRMLAPRWLALAPGCLGRYSQPVIRPWNDGHHVAATNEIWEVERCLVL